jgi:hypothetical protein
MKSDVKRLKRRNSDTISGAAEQEMQQRFTENLRYILWSSKNLERSDWATTLAGWAKCDIQRAKELLRGANPSAEEQERIAAAVERSESDLRHSRLIEDEGVNILRTNVLHLLESLGHGEQGQLAKAIGVDEDTVTSWKSGQGIRSKNLIALSAYFGLKSNVDLRTNPIFLELTPFGDMARRKRLQSHIDQLEPDSLQDLFPALERLLREP